MLLRDFAVLALICMVWALNTVLSKIVVTDMSVPPLFFATLRFALVAIAVAPWLLPMPRPRWRLLAVAVLIGGASFALVFVGLRTASPSSVAVVTQLGVPITTLLSVVMLGEHIRWRRALGIVLSFTGVMLVMWDPRGLELSAGLLFVAAAAFAGSLGAVMMKQMEGVKPLQFQAWVGFASLPPLAALSALIETNQASLALAAGPSFVAVVAFSALIVSVIGHTSYYRLIQTYDATLIAPLTLMSPLFTIALGVGLTGDELDLRIVLGAGLALAGVLIIAVRRNHVMPLALLLRNRF